jgi:autotransporter-associated beta strand protein
MRRSRQTRNRRRADALAVQFAARLRRAMVSCNSGFPVPFSAPRISSRRLLPSAFAILTLISVIAFITTSARAQFTTFSTVANNAYATGDVNSCAIGINNLTTVGNFQFIAYYNNLSHVMVGRRTLGTSTWQTFDSGYTGTTSDDHDVIGIAVDSAGFMHMSWDMHNVGLNYAISNATVTGTTLSSLVFTTQTAANAPTLFPSGGSTTNEVTYPQFYSIPNSNNLLFTYRNGGTGGGSGNGDQFVNIYNPANHTWTNNMVINGEQTSVNGYLNRMAYTSTGNLLATWTWRATPNWQTNSDMMYAQSPDNGTTWYQQGGTTQYALPIIQNTSNGGTPAQVAQVIKSIPQNSSYINQTSMTVDANNNPIVATYWAPNWNTVTNSGDPNRQYMLVYYDGAAWRTSQITSRISDTVIDASGSNVRDLGRPVVLSDNQGRVLVVTRSEDTSMGSYSNPSTPNNNIVVYYNTAASLDSANPIPWRSISIDAANMGAWEPTYDSALWTSQNKLSLFYEPVNLGLSSATLKVLDWDEVGYFASLSLNSWNNSGGGDWDTATNWNNNSIPNGTAAIAKFGTGVIQPAADSVITLSGTKTVGSLTFDSPVYDYTLASGTNGALALNNGAGTAATITVASGTHFIAVPVSLTSDGVNISTASGTSLTISGNITGSGGLTQTSAGTLILSGSNSYSGATSVTGGVLRAAGAALSSSSNLSISGGLFGSSVTRTLGTAAGQIQLLGGASGFTADAGDITVTLNNGPNPAQWGTSTFNPSQFVLNNSTALGNVTVTNRIDLGTSTRSISVGANAATLSGIVSGSGGLTKDGVGTLILSATNSYTGATTVNSGTLYVTGSIAATSAINFNNAGSEVLRAGTGANLGNAIINIASNGGTPGPTCRLELTGGVSVGNAITFAPRNNSSVAIESLAGNNVLTGTMTIVTGGNQSRVQVDNDQLTISGALTTSATSARNFYLQGVGTGIFSGIISDNASNSSGKINVNKEGAGTWTLAGANTYTGTTTVTGGTLAAAHPTAFGTGALTINTAATAKLQAGLTAPLQLASLTIVGGTSPSATLDVTNNNVVLHNGTISTTLAQIKTALNSTGALWAGQGITSTTAAADAASNSNTTVFAVGAIKNIDKTNALIYSTWPAPPSPDGGVSGLTTTDVLVKYTYFGDANLNGVVDNTTDYDLWSNGFTNPGLAAANGWLYGDFDYSGTVDNTTDYDLWSTGFAHQGSALAGATWVSPVNVQPVPEPNSLLLAALACGLCSLRRIILASPNAGKRLKRVPRDAHVDSTTDGLAVSTA